MEEAMKDRQGGMTRRNYLAATGAGALALGLGTRGAVDQQVISDIKLPDSQLARAATQFVRETESDFLFQRVNAVFFLVEGTTERLRRIAELIDRGELKTRVGAVLPLADAREVPT
jgi:hypothetical protein